VTQRGWRAPLKLLLSTDGLHASPLQNGWTGYSWDKTLFPAPRDIAGYVHSKGLALAANLHDADGVGTFEDAYPQVAAAMGQADGKAVTFDLVNQSYVYALEDLVRQAARGLRVTLRVALRALRPCCLA
jgi:hypothetical protein